jgi:hypothetical protein
MTSWAELANESCLCNQPLHPANEDGATKWPALDHGRPHGVKTLLLVVSDCINKTNMVKLGIYLWHHSLKIATLKDRKAISVEVTFADELGNKRRYRRVPSKRNPTDWQHDFNEGLKRFPDQKHVCTFEISPIAIRQWDTSRQKDVDHE